MKNDRYKHMDYQSVELFAALSGESVARLEQRWRKEVESIPLPLNTTLRAALNKLPATWIDGICLCLGVPTSGTRRQKVVRIVTHLNNEATLKKTVTGLSRGSIEALTYTLGRGGWVKYGELSRRFGHEVTDSWWWDKKPPQSTLGQLRLRGLLFVGRTPIWARLYKAAIIPQELRGLLADALGSKLLQLTTQPTKAASTKPYRTLGVQLGELKLDYATFATEDSSIQKYYQRFMSYFQEAASPGQRNAEGFAEEEYLWNFRLPGSDRFLVDCFLEQHGQRIPEKFKNGMLNWRGAELRYCRVLAAKDLLLLEDLDTGQKIRCLSLNIAVMKVFRKRVGDAVIGYISRWDEDIHCLMGYCAVVAVTENTRALYQDLKQTLREVNAKTHKYFARPARGVRAKPAEIPEVFRKAFED